MAIKEKLTNYSNLVVLLHSFFALPFALSAFHIASLNRIENLDKNYFYILILCALAVFSARTSSMTFNRIVDAKIDKKNPRTSNREIPSNKVSKIEAYIILFLSSLLFFYFAFLLGPHCFIFSPFVLAFLFFYSLTKRFTALSHFFLGAGLALAPGGAWWIFRPSIELIPVLLMLGVLFWVAGFDILYSCQDEKFDKDNKLKSIPAKFGIPVALKISFFLHILSIVLLSAFALVSELGVVFFFGFVIFSAFLMKQHFLLKENDLSMINKAFFTYNAYASVLFYLFVLISY